MLLQSSELWFDFISLIAILFLQSDADNVVAVETKEVFSDDEKLLNVSFIMIQTVALIWSCSVMLFLYDCNDVISVWLQFTYTLCCNAL